MIDYDAVIISDLHLGSPVCQAESISEFLRLFSEGVVRTRELILNGDVFDSIDFRRLRKRHWKILSQLRKLATECRIVWVCGNHDGPAEVISHLLGVEVKDEHLVTTGGVRMLVLHGHTFDEFIDEHPVITAAADFVYRLLQFMDRSHSMARRAKYGSKTFLRCAWKVRDGAAQLAAKRGFDAVSCGHTHHAAVEQVGDVTYYNSGCWTELPCTLLTVRAGETTLMTYDEFRAEHVERGQLVLFTTNEQIAA